MRHLILLSVTWSVLLYSVFFSNTVLADEENGTFLMLSYNIRGSYSPKILGKSVTGNSEVTRGERKKMGEKLQNEADSSKTKGIIAVQEDWMYRVPHDLCNAWSWTRKNISMKFKSCPQNIRNCPPINWNDGLNIFSDFDFIDAYEGDPEGRIDCKKIERKRWDDIAISADFKNLDFMAKKGFSFTRLKITSNFEVDVYNIHVGPLKAHNPTKKKANATRRNNINQLAQYIAQKSEDRAVIVVGDTNLHWNEKLWAHEHKGKKKYPEDVETFKNFKKNTGLVSACEVMKNCECKETKEDKCVKQWPLPHSVALDQVLYRGNKKYTLEVKTFEQLDWRDQKSDHQPVKVLFTWNKN